MQKQISEENLQYALQGAWAKDSKAYIENLKDCHCGEKDTRIAELENECKEAIELFEYMHQLAFKCGANKDMAFGVAKLIQDKCRQGIQRECKRQALKEGEK